MSASPHSTTYEICDLLSSLEFLERPVTGRDPAIPPMVLQRTTKLLADEPGRVLLALVEAARDMCLADSAGVTLERRAEDGTTVFYLAAIAGAYGPFTESVLPQALLPCEFEPGRQGPQRLRVSQQFFAERGMDAPQVTDGILVPWDSGGQRATLWVLAHERTPAFHLEDYRLMGVLADFASHAYGNLQVQETVVRKASLAASSAMAHTLAHHINNPLQSITNSIYLAQHGCDDSARIEHIRQASSDLKKLSELVGKLLLSHQSLARPGV